MAIDTLAVFGDSWPAGEELENQDVDSFPVLLSERLNLKLVNLAQKGTSIDQAVLHLLNNVELLTSGNTAVLFCLTSIARSSYFSDNRLIQIHPRNKDLASVSYYSYMYSDTLGKFNLLRNMLLIQGTGKQLGIPVFFVLNWNDVAKHKLLELDFVCPESFFNMLGLQNVEKETDNSFASSMQQNKYIRPNIAHPNIEGHRVIADKLFNWLKDKI